MSEKKFLTERQIDSLSFPEPPSDFADRVMGALLTPQQIQAPKKVSAPKRPKTLLWAAAIAASYGAGVISSPAYLSSNEEPALLLQPIPQSSPTTTIAQPAGGSMSPAYTLGALSLLGAIFGPLGPLAEPTPKQTKKFCKEALRSCEEDPSILCESVWELCLDAPKSKKQKDAKDSCEEAPPSPPPTKEAFIDEEDIEDMEDQLDALEDELDALADHIDDLADDLDECYEDNSCSQEEINQLEREIAQEQKKLSKKLGKLEKERFEFEFKWSGEAPVAPIPPGPSIAPLPPLPPVSPAWGKSVIIIRDGQVITIDAAELDSDCEECQRGLSQQDAQRAEKYQQELEEAIKKYQEGIEQYVEELDQEINKTERKVKKEKKHKK